MASKLSPAASARETLEHHREAALDCIRALETRVKAYGKSAKADTDYGYAGTMNHVASELGDVLAFIGGEARGGIQAIAAAVGGTVIARDTRADYLPPIDLDDVRWEITAPKPVYCYIRDVRRGPKPLREWLEDIAGIDLNSGIVTTYGFGSDDFKGKGDPRKWVSETPQPMLMAVVENHTAHGPVPPVHYRTLTVYKSRSGTSLAPHDLYELAVIRAQIV